MWRRLCRVGVAGFCRGARARARRNPAKRSTLSAAGFRDHGGERCGGEGYHVYREGAGFLFPGVVVGWFFAPVVLWGVPVKEGGPLRVGAPRGPLARHGKPEIFNTDQGSQFTGTAFTGLLAASDIRISMDGKGAWRDNVFVERLWRGVI